MGDPRLVRVPPGDRHEIARRVVASSSPSTAWLLAVVLLCTLIGVCVPTAGPAAAAAAAAEPVCHTHADGSTTCVTAVNLSPSSVESATGGTLSVTVLLSGTRTAFDGVGVGYFLPSDQALSGRLSPVVGERAMYRGSLEVPARAPVGAFRILDVSGWAISDPGQSWRLGGAELAAAGISAPLTITGTPDTTAPEIRSVALSATSPDARTCGSRAATRSRSTRS